MKENKEETKLQSEQKTKEDILHAHFQCVATPVNNRAPLETQLTLVLQAALLAMEEYASQFKSQLPIEQKDEFVKYLESEADKFQKDGGNSEYFAGGIRYAAHLVRLNGTADDRQPLGIAHLMRCGQSQPLPIEGVERYTVEDLNACWQAARDYEFNLCNPVQRKYYPNYDEWLATRKGSTSDK